MSICKGKHSVSKGARAARGVRSLRTERPRWQALLPAELYDLAHACFNKDPHLRPDVLALMRHPYIVRAQREPCDLGAYLLTALGPPAVPGHS